MGSNLLVTGAGGLIGSHAVGLLQQLDLQVVTYRSIFPNGDLLLPGAVEKCLELVKPSHVLHLAWAASSTPNYRNDPTNKDWGRCTLTLASLCTKLDIAFWGMGSIAELDTRAQDPYTTAKGLVWRSLRRAIHLGKVGWLRPHYVFDPVRESPALFRELALARNEGRPAQVHSPDTAHDFIHASDVASAIHLAIDASMLGLVEIGSGRTRTVRDVCIAFEVDVGTARTMSPKSEGTECADTSRLQSVGWSPEATENFFGGGLPPPDTSWGAQRA